MPKEFSRRDLIKVAGATLAAVVIGTSVTRSKPTRLLPEKKCITEWFLI